ncbi:Alpha/beta hydrolase family protein [Granulibacter bethesdensis]|uniref:Alpha/beta hydrolase family protein n=2 Tax=Granulibacter bethesdensis TaxID=364410 RepID=A0AAN0RCL6_9PROT|nr:Alpha/beta hydrolase family protein [Granulibacter bethesdensis]
MEKRKPLMTASRIVRPDGIRLAAHCHAGRSPTVVFLPGFRSDMEGEKALRLAAWCEAEGQAMLRLDYSGHGQSEGRFEDGCIGTWLNDALTVIEKTVRGKLILVGSSMGGWIALLAARQLGDRVVGLVGIAAAPDFTERLMWDVMPAEERETLLREGVLMAPNPYGPPVPITRRLIEDGRTHLLLNAPLPLSCPVRLLQGQEDHEVPWETATLLSQTITRPDGSVPDLVVTLIRDGNHRLSRESDISRIIESVKSVLDLSNT